MERLLVFPHPLPDESLYSVAVRYHRTMANKAIVKPAWICSGHIHGRVVPLYRAALAIYRRD